MTLINPVCTQYTKLLNIHTQL